MQETAIEAYQLIRSSGAKLADRWPTLVALVLGGFAAKLIVLKVALLAGHVAWFFGVFFYAFTAAALLAAVVPMFRSIFPGQPWPHFTVALVPFLVIYLASGHFDGYPVDPAQERPVTMDIAAASVLIVVIAARWLLPLWSVFRAKSSGKSWAKWVTSALDICWISLVAFTITTHPVWQWLAGFVTPVSWVLEAVLAVLVVPLAWMALGGFVWGLRPGDAPELLRRAGAPLVLVSCLMVLVLEKLPLVLWQIERLIIGARDPQSFWIPVSGLLGAVNSAVGVLLTVALVAAFLDYATRDLGQHETGVGGQGFLAHDPYGNGFRVGGRDEEDGHLIGR